MKFHEVDMMGKNWCERVSSLPTWEDSFIGRVVYNTSDGIIYYANPSKWVPLYIFKTIRVSGQDDIIADDVEDVLTLVADDGITLTTDATTDAVTIRSAASFGKISVSGQLDLDALLANSTLTLASSNSGLSIFTTPETNTVTFTVNYGGEMYPSISVAGMGFYKTDEKYLYMRNATNTGWIKLFHEDRPPLDQRDGGIFSADLLDGYHYSIFGATLSSSGNYTQLLNPTASVLSSIIIPYATTAGNALLLEGHPYSDVANYYIAGTSYNISYLSNNHTVAGGGVWTTTDTFVMARGGSVNVYAYYNMTYYTYGRILKNGEPVEQAGPGYSFTQSRNVSVSRGDVIQIQILSNYPSTWNRGRVYGQVTAAIRTAYPEIVVGSYSNTYTPPPVVEGGGCCFTWDTSVLLANGIWKPIYLLNIGDMIKGQDGNINTVLGMHRVVLGNHRKLYRFDDNTIFSNDHPFLIKKDGREIWGSCDIEQVKRTPEYRKLHNNIVKIDGPVHYKHIEGWKYQSITEIEASSEIELYTPILDGDATLIANGYITFGIPAEDVIE